jgi:ornithine carbamoyltransferase
MVNNRRVKRFPTWHQPRRLLSITDLAPADVLSVVEHGLELTGGAGLGYGYQPLIGRAVGLIFDKPSLRTRVSFEVGIARLGGVTTTLTGPEVGLGTRESAADVAQALSRYVDAIVVRTLSHATMTELADAATVPVISALTEHEHPCQALADMLTLRQHLGPLPGHQLVFVGDGNNVCNSLLLAGASVGLNVRVATPQGYEPDRDVVDAALEIASETGARIELAHDPVSAVVGADAVYTDVWASMGAESEAAERRRVFAPFALTSELLAGAPRALVMHCLPAHRGEEIAADVIDGPQSVVFDQAENRMYAQQAVLIHLLAQPAHARRGLIAGSVRQPTHHQRPISLVR